MVECSCDESTSCIYHILIYLDSDRWSEYFNGLRNDKVSAGAYPLSHDQRTAVISALDQYTRMSYMFIKLSYQTIYRPQHNRSAIHPNVSCKCYYCLGDNINRIKHIIQLQQCCKFPILL
jgi:hypothetical protein